MVLLPPSFQALLQSWRQTTKTDLDLGRLAGTRNPILYKLENRSILGMAYRLDLNAELIDRSLRLFSRLGTPVFEQSASDDLGQSPSEVPRHKVIQQLSQNLQPQAVAPDRQPNREIPTSRTRRREPRACRPGDKAV